MKLACKDLDPNTTCDFEATGDYAEEVAIRMMNHMKNEHMDKVKEMQMSNSEIMSMLESKVHE